MTQLYETLHGHITTLTNKYSRTNKPLPLEDLTLIISTIFTVYSEEMLNLPSKFISRINEALEGLLNNLSALADATETSKELKDRMDMFHELLSIILDRYDSKGDSGLLSRLITFSLKQLKPCLPSLKPKLLNEVLNTISCSKKISPICPFPKSKVSLKHYVTSLLFQFLHENKYQKIEEVLHEYLAASEDMKMGEFESYLLSWIGIYGMKECYMGYRVLGGIFEAYIKEFSANYAKDAKYNTTKYDPKILGIMIRSLNSFMNDVSIVEDVKSELEEAGCNICTHIAINPHSYYLQICDSIYTINLCKSCQVHLTASNNFTSDIMIQLALTCEPIHNDKEIEGLREVIGIDSGVFCEINSELRLVKDKLLRCGMCARNIGKCLPNLWAALMILANHNDSAVRSKALKVIIETYTPTENETKESKMLEEKISKCIANRVLDTDEKVRHVALLGIIMLQDIETAFRIVDREYADGIGGTTLMVGEVAEKLITRVTAKKGGIKPDQIISFLEVMARLGLVHASRSKLSKTRNTRTSNSTPTAISLLTPHMSQLQSLLKPHNKSQNLQNELCTLILFPETEIESEIYTTMIEMLREISKDRLGTWLHSSEMIEMVINNIVFGKKFDGIGNEWLLRIIVSYKEFLVVERLMLRIIEVSESEGFARESQQYSVCMSLCKLLQSIFCADLLELKEWLLKHKKDLQKLWACIIHNVLVETGREGQDEEDVFGLCRLLGEIDKTLKDIHQTVEVYFNCCDFISQTLRDIEEKYANNIANDEDNKDNDTNIVSNANNNKDSDDSVKNKPLEIGSTLQTIKISLFLLPQITNNIRELNKKIEFDCHTELFHHSILAILEHLFLCKKEPQASKKLKALEQEEEDVKGNTYDSRNEGDNENEERLILESGKLLVRLWSLVPEYLEEDEEKILEFLEMSNPKLNNILLMGIYSIICSEPKIAQLEKIRDLFMSIMHSIPLLSSFRPILQSLPFYLIIKQLVSKGLLTYLHVGKNVIYGLCGYGSAESDIIKVCGEIIREVSGDLVESRQLFANFGETLKFIILMEGPPATHMLYLLTSSCYLPTLPNLILSKHEQSLESLKPTIYKSFCEHLNKLVTSGRILISSDQNTSELFLVMNSIVKCNFIHLDDYRAVMNCLIAVVDSIYLEVTVGSRGTGAEVHLWSVLRGLAYLGQGYPARQACREAEKLFIIKNQIVQIQGTNKIQLEKVPLEEIYEEINELHETILYGCSEASDEEENDEFTTYDTSNETERKQSKGYKENAKIKNATKAKMNSRKGENENFKKTKKAFQKIRSKSSPKLEENWGETCADDSVENLEYKKKLRNKAKVVF